MGHRFDTSLGGPNCMMLDTQWTAIVKYAETRDDGYRRSLMDDLCKRYWKPVYAYLRQKGYDNDKAKDLTQGFFATVVLGRDLLRKADRARGRFRTYLLTALMNYVKDEHRKQTGRKRCPEGGLGPLMDDEEVKPIAGTSPEEAYTRQWTAALLDDVLGQVGDWYCNRGRSGHWEVFRERQLWELLGRTGPAPYETLCKKLGVAQVKTVENMLETVKRRFRKVLEARVRAFVASTRDVEPEIQDLISGLLAGCESPGSKDRDSKD